MMTVNEILQKDKVFEVAKQLRRNLANAIVNDTDAKSQLQMIEDYKVAKEYIRTKGWTDEYESQFSNDIVSMMFE